MVRIERENLQRLFDVLKARGFDIVGPTLRDQAIVYDRIESMRDLPEGWKDEQSPGKYRIIPRADKALFGYVLGPISWKKFLFPPLQKLWSAQRQDNRLEFTSIAGSEPPMAFLGVRACELAAIAIQDKIFLKGQRQDPVYKQKRDQVFLVAVNCTEPAGTCFCVSMNSGPHVTAGYDIALTEVVNASTHYFLATAGTTRGQEILNEIPHQEAQDAERTLENELMAKSAQSMGRSMNTANIKELLYANLEHPQWDKTAERCLSCANCTMSCPTCFCSTAEDVTDLTGNHAERWRKWDSCFTMDFSHIHGGSIRSSGKSRYRQWMTHKLASWHDQFGTSGCVGCGRCITWCPVGIDITQEAAAIRKTGVDSKK